MQGRPSDNLRAIYRAKVTCEEARTLSNTCISQVVTYGLDALSRCMDSAEGYDENRAAFTTYRHVLACSDGIGELLDEACVEPAEIVLRSAFEGLLSVEYLLKEHTEARGYALLVCEVEKRRAYYDGLRTTNVMGQQLRKELPSLGALTDEMIDMQLGTYDSMLCGERWDAAHAEWKRLRQKGVTFPNWFSFYDGPKNIRQLASLLELGTFYEMLYQRWSKRVHAAEIRNALWSTSEGSTTIQGLRQCDGIATRSSYAITFATRAVRALIGHYRPGELTDGVWDRWYGTNVAPLQRRLDELANKDEV